jgi:hypothetical protein
VTDTLRALSEENHRIHGVADQPPLPAYTYLVGEMRELGDALFDWDAADTAHRPGLLPAVAAEVADCVIILDHILRMVGGPTVLDAVRDKVAADRVKHQPDPCPLHGDSCRDDPAGCVAVHQAECAANGLPLLDTGGEA